ncbi:MAG: 6-carboxytetrahydropterin synthase [Phycisphaerales bacterium]|nr:6-carboxytetrahydropterin synthase [Phycisphaerales bacterium]
MNYRVCKAFEIESGHMLSMHPGRCRFPHGHTRRVEIVLAAPDLDANGMVCDFQAIKLAVRECLDRLDHALCVNSLDPNLPGLAGVRERVVVFEKTEPTTEVLARYIYDHVAAQIRSGREFEAQDGRRLRLPPHLVVERVRVSETSSTWAEYGK